jgi:hypothetical protein
VSEKRDIIEDIFFRVRKILGEDIKTKVIVLLDKEEENVRMEWAGTEQYIAKKRSKNKVRAELGKGTHIKDMPAKVGISRRQIYRLLKQRD